MRKLLRPNVIIPIVVSLALIGALLGASNLATVATVIGRLQARDVLSFFLLMLVYEAVRGLQWHLLLRGLGIRPPLAAELFSFLLGEATKSAPIGNYFQNYLLAQVDGDDLGWTSATSTLIVLTEVALGLVGVALIGIDDWTWLRPLILIGSAVFLGLVVLAHRTYGQHAHPPAWLSRHNSTRALLEELGRFRRGMATLSRPRVLGVEAALSAIYLVLAATALYVAARALGVETLSFPAMLGLYLFSDLAGLILPLPVDIGVVELTGVGALIASGVSSDVAISLMLVNRLLSVGSSVAIAGIALLPLRDELHRALHPLSRAAPPSEASSASSA